MCAMGAGAKIVCAAFLPVTGPRYDHFSAIRSVFRATLLFDLFLSREMVRGSRRSIIRF